MVWLRSTVIAIARWSGSIAAIALATVSLVVYLVVGLATGFTETYNLIANTVMSAISYILIFVIQYTQNLDGRATQLKLDELISALKPANNAMIKIEELGEEQLAALEVELRRRRDTHYTTTP